MASFPKSVLLVHLEDEGGLRQPEYLKDVVVQAAQQTSSHLRVIIASPLFDPKTGIAPVQHFSEMQRFLVFIYAAATSVAQSADNILMVIEVLLQAPSETARIGDQSWDHVFVSTSAKDIESSFLTNTSAPRSYLEEGGHVPLSIGSSTVKATPEEPSSFPVIVLGGTFDHLHAGHRILLSLSAWIASEKVIIGITDDIILVKKANREVLEGLEERTRRTREFLELFKPGLIYDIVPIKDVYGPTAWDPNIQALVVSKETLSGASAIAKLREEKGLPPLQQFVIEVISPAAETLSSENATVLKEAKMSSTFIRQWIVNKREEKSKPPSGASSVEAPMPGGWSEPGKEYE